MMNFKENETEEEYDYTNEEPLEDEVDEHDEYDADDEEREQCD